MDALSVTNPPAELMQNALGVLTQSGINVHEELKKTTEAYQEHITKTDALIEEQAARIAALEADVIQAKAEKDQEIAALKSEKAAREGYLQRGIDTLNEKVAYQQRGIDKLNGEVAHLTNLLSEYKDIIWGLTHNRLDTAYDKIRRFRVLN